MEEKKRCWGLMRCRPCLVPTWRGWLLLVLCFLAASWLVVRGIGPFLAVSEPVPGGAAPGGVLVVEGWARDYVLETVVQEFRREHYDKVFVTGGPLEWGAPLAEYKTYAQRGAAILLRLGLETNSVDAVPSPLVRQDRTYASAVTLKQWWRAHGLAPTKVLLITEGAHARRSWLLFEKALGKNVSVGVEAAPDPDYDLDHWWRSSAGVRGIIGEALAYGYARLLFRASQ
jgi:uncharacterized SAM-binding protein YcdF (DUF218 family)